MAQPEFYQIKVKGHLDRNWSGRFGGLMIESEHGETMIFGWLPDQAALHGLLIQIRDLGLPLLSFQRLDPPPQGEEGDPG